MKEDILAEFKRQESVLTTFKDKIIVLISELLAQNQMSIHHIGGRTKTYDSLSMKIDKKNGKYKSMQDITDIVGIRIITYLESDVDKIANLLEAEFDIDKENSVDKRVLKLDQFGYKSLHHVLSLKNTRSGLTEYKPYKECKFEVQIRSILQHAWAEIEHDLGYKGKSAIPSHLARSFNRLAALLESADIEFDRLKEELSIYEKEVPKLIQREPESLPLNQATLESFIDSNSVLQKVTKHILHLGFSIYPDADFGGIIGRFDFFEINTIKQLDEVLESTQEEFLKFVTVFLETVTIQKLPRTIVIFYFQHFLAARKINWDYVHRYLICEDPIISDIEGDTAESLIDVYKRSRQLK